MSAEIRAAGDIERPPGKEKPNGEKHGTPPPPQHLGHRLPRRRPSGGSGHHLDPAAHHPHPVSRHPGIGLLETQEKPAIARLGGGVGVVPVTREKLQVNKRSGVPLTGGG